VLEEPFSKEFLEIDRHAREEFDERVRPVIDNSLVRRYCSGQKKRWFEFPIPSKYADIFECAVS
jgi:hypothetical protein